MGTKSGASTQTKGVSIITCTKRPAYIDRLFQNFHSQRWKKKELIIVINKDDLPLENYQKRAKRYKNVTVYKLPEATSLGACLNFAVKKARYDYVAKFDDDDYYGPLYLTECMGIFQKTNADIVGKRAHFMYLSGSRTLLLRFYNAENKYVAVVPGATLVMKRDVFGKVRFADVNLGEDHRFCNDSRAKGFTIFSGSKWHFAAIRRKNSAGHTWIITEKRLRANRAKMMPHPVDLKSFINGSKK
ncbi:UNVERIFIED_CONTAM: glycosyltransferase involved in cell wall biosynthesis [Brevibacillus sp. OAP136]